VPIRTGVATRSSAQPVVRGGPVALRTSIAPAPRQHPTAGAGSQRTARKFRIDQQSRATALTRHRAARPRDGGIRPAGENDPGISLAANGRVAALQRGRRVRALEQPEAVGVTHRHIRACIPAGARDNRRPEIPTAALRGSAFPLRSASRTSGRGRRASTARRM
jgi:hypothetical protein